MGETVRLQRAFLVVVVKVTGFWKPCTHVAGSIHEDLGLLSTLPRTTVTTTRNISTFTLFYRSVLTGQRNHLLTPEAGTPQDAP